MSSTAYGADNNVTALKPSSRLGRGTNTMLFDLLRSITKYGYSVKTVGALNVNQSKDLKSMKLC